MNDNLTTETGSSEPANLGSSHGTSSETQDTQPQTGSSDQRRVILNIEEPQLEHSLINGLRAERRNLVIKSIYDSQEVEQCPTALTSHHIDEFLNEIAVNDNSAVIWQPHPLSTYDWFSKLKTEGHTGPRILLRGVGVPTRDKELILSAIARGEIATADETHTIIIPTRDIVRKILAILDAPTNSQPEQAEPLAEETNL